MGLSSKQVSSDHGLDWNQTLLQEQNLQLPKPAIGKRQQQPSNQQLEPLKCPRCDSTNTKFCYYNNYNKSQPRYFCKACKRHWTKGGTLRNVPVGGGRKNKRLKTSKNSPTTTTILPSTTATTTTTTTNIINKVSPNMIIQAHQVQKHQNLSFSIGDQKNASEILCQGLINPLSSSVLQQNSIGSNNFTSKSFNNNGNMFMSSSSGFPQGLISTFPYSNSTSCSFDTNPSSISSSFQSPNPNIYNNNYSNGETTMEDSIITTIMPTTSSSNISQNLHEQPWKIPNVSTRAMDFTTNYWNWDDIDSFVSSNELNLTWDDSEIKP